jgi:signal transduction histidine kinase
MGRLQKERGLDRVPLANRGRTVVVYERGVVFCTGHADRDPGVEIGVTETLGVRSILTVPLRVGNEIRGVLGAVSSRPDHFSTEDQRFFETAAQWVGVIAHRAELVEAMRQTAADEARRLAADELMTALAHELGNYLAPLKGRIDVLRRRLEREGRARDEEDIYEAAQAVSRLQQLVTQLLDSARLDAGLFSLALQPVDLVPLIEQVVQDMGGSWPALETRLADELEVQADPVRIAEVLVNLLTNAIQYSPDEAPILLTATAEQRADGPWAVVRIQNEGRVIDPDLLPHLFDRFVSGGQSGGLGLGLYLARRIVEAHGGVISVDARAEQGTTFVVAVPCRSPD